MCILGRFCQKKQSTNCLLAGKSSVFPGDFSISTAPGAISGGQISCPLSQWPILLVKSSFLLVKSPFLLKITMFCHWHHHPATLNLRKIAKNYYVQGFHHLSTFIGPFCSGLLEVIVLPSQRKWVVSMVKSGISKVHIPLIPILSTLISLSGINGKLIHL